MTILLLLQGLSSSARPHRTRNIDVPKVIAMTSDSSRMRDACLSVFGVISAGDFFQSLKPYKTRDGGTRFRRYNAEVTSFPDHLEITVMIHAIRCDGDVRRSTLEVLDSTVVDTFQLKAEWKGTDGALRLARLGASRVSMQKVSQAELEWQMKTEVDSDGVNIRDRLVLSLRTEKGDRIARISGGVSDH